MEPSNSPDRAQFVIRLSHDGDAAATAGYAIVEQTAFVGDDGGEGGGAVMLDAFRRMFEQHADTTLAALPLSGSGGEHGGVELASFAGASVGKGASVEV